MLACGNAYTGRHRLIICTYTLLRNTHTDTDAHTHFNVYFTIVLFLLTNVCVFLGQHGSSTTSYFSVLRWLMFLNLFVAVVMVGAIVLPQVFFQPDSFPETFSNNTSLTGALLKQLSYHLSNNIGNNQNKQ